MTSRVAFADLFDGEKPVRRSAGVRLEGPWLVVEFDSQRRQYPVRAVRVASVPGVPTRFISLPDGAELHCAFDPLLDALPPDSRLGALSARLAEKWWASVAGVAMLFASLMVLLMTGGPRAADAVVARISWQQEVRIGRDAIASLVPPGREPSRLALDTRAALRARFQEVFRGLPRAESYRLAFAPGRAPNAYAFPGGNIVLTDALVEVCTSDEVLAIIAHEIGHVEHRHPLRQAARGAAASALLGLLTTDVSAVSSGAASLFEVLTKTRYSREFESEADEFAFALLRARGLSPSLFASCLQRLPGPGGSGSWEFLSTHPASEARAARARSAAQP